jgi:hypothetical protein
MGERGSAEEDASIEAAAELLRRAAEAEAVDEERALAESALAALGGAEGDVRDDDVGVTFDDVQTRDDANDDDDESDARKSTVFSGRRGKKRGSPSALAAWRVKALDLAAHAAMLAGDWPAASRRFEALVPRRIAACGSRFHPRVALDLVTLRAVLAQAEEGVGGAVEEEKKKKKEKVEEATRDALDVLRVVAGEASELFVDTKREAVAGR